jgi:hypothetical protein
MERLPCYLVVYEREPLEYCKFVYIVLKNEIWFVPTSGNKSHLDILPCSVVHREKFHFDHTKVDAYELEQGRVPEYKGAIPAYIDMNTGEVYAV